MPILYAYDGQLYPQSAVDHDPATGQPDSDNYVAYVVPDKVTLTVDQLTRGYGNIVEILMASGQVKPL